MRSWPTRRALTSSLGRWVRAILGRTAVRGVSRPRHLRSVRSQRVPGDASGPHGWSKQGLRWRLGAGGPGPGAVDRRRAPDDSERELRPNVLARLVRSGGQVPLSPPNVSGWPTGDAWFSTSATAARLGGRQGHLRCHTRREPGTQGRGQQRPKRTRPCIGTTRRLHIDHGECIDGSRRQRQATPGSGAFHTRLGDCMTPSRNPELTRRRFIALGGGTALWMVTGCRADDNGVLSVPTTTGPTAAAPTTEGNVATFNGPSENDRVLVVVQMLGGNDALNTLVPSDGRYRDARPTLAIPESDLLSLSGTADFALHPGLAPLLPHWESGTMAAAAGVAFGDQTRSHFESRDVWWRATGDPGAAGWLARWMDAAAIDTLDEPMEAIALGVGPRALAGSSASAVDNPADFQLEAPSGLSAAQFEKFLLDVSLGTADESDILSAARGSLPATLSVQKILEDLADDSAGDAYLDRNEPALAIQMRTAAALIGSRPGLRVVTVGIDGFDTHADQLSRQADLLAGTATAISDFWAALSPSDQARTLVMTTSEFGRRVAENGSGGTDHGNSGTQLLLGGGVNGGQIAGGYDFGGLIDGDLPTAVPGVDLFADALRWLGGPVHEVLGMDPPATGLVSA